MCTLKLTELEMHNNEASHEDGYHISGICDADIDEEDSLYMHAQDCIMKINMKSKFVTLKQYTKRLGHS